MTDNDVLYDEQWNGAYCSECAGMLQGQPDTRIMPLAELKELWANERHAWCVHCSKTLWKK